MYSDNVDLQRSASLTFAEITERGQELSTCTPETDAHLWQMLGKLTGTPLSQYYPCSKTMTLRFSELQALPWEIWLSTVKHHVLQLGSADSYEAENKVSIVLLGGLAPLIRQMNSPNVEVQCNAVGCITNLATHEDNKAKIARSGALVPLTRLARSKDMRVQRNATGALLNMTHSGIASREHLMIYHH